MSYKNLDIWDMANNLVVEIHKMTMEDLPGFERFEEGNQIRRSVKSIKSNIVEGYGRRRYKLEFIHFLVIAHASLEETIDHLETLSATGSLKNEEKYKKISGELDLLGRKLNRFIQAVEVKHNRRGI